MYDKTKSEVANYFHIFKKSVKVVAVFVSGVKFVKMYFTTDTDNLSDLPDIDLDAVNGKYMAHCKDTLPSYARITEPHVHTTDGSNFVWTDISDDLGSLVIHLIKAMKKHYKPVKGKPLKVTREEFHSNTH